MTKAPGPPMTKAPYEEPRPMKAPPPHMAVQPVLGASGLPIKAPPPQAAVAPEIALYPIGPNGLPITDMRRLFTGINYLSLILQ